VRLVPEFAVPIMPARDLDATLALVDPSGNLVRVGSPAFVT